MARFSFSYGTLATRHRAFETWPTDDIATSSMHRVIRRVAIYLSNLSPQVIKWPTQNEKTVLIFLWYIGHQTSSFRDVADRFDIAISSMHRVIRRVAIYLSNLSPQVIKWPTQNEKAISAEHFRNNGFSNIIRVIDGCHIKIDKPEHDADSYINRKGFYSIQMQAVVDHIMKFKDVLLGYPGSVHDSRVYRTSPLGQNLEESVANIIY
ncbi:hypothetical protein ANN_26050 [Periplaneta americana]|uniref:DDE Tnp4 domain-containing protein n=1 Tax=Periplaneta americana TaxID=6978 RepID=A0ABQ8S4U9_PERAM|nr:hypothetical protein ANN_26050 [Periplaneta americana]